MRAYETIYILRPDLDEEQTKGMVEKFSSLIQNNGGELVKTETWGKRRLAYEVKDFRDGYYVLYKLKGTAKTVAELERIYKITDEVIRYLIIKEDE